jgi:hypothetical protein
MQTALKPTDYLLRIFSPDSKEDTFEDFSSPTPFNAFAVGDVIDQINASLAPGKGLRVTGIVHRLHHLGEGQIAHYTGLYTEEIDLD